MLKKNIMIWVWILFSLFACQENDGIRLAGVVSCTDGLLNGGETSVDCGGECPPCNNDIKLPEGGYESASSYEGYKLVWSDEFDQPELNKKKWSFHYGDGCPSLCYWGNSELQYYTSDPENVILHEGNLVIRAIRENLGGRSFSSARLHTDNKFEFKYGRIDVRAAMPSAVGTWTAIWLLNKKYDIKLPAKYWPSGGEIDIVEYLGEEKRKILGTAHFGKNFPDNHRYISKYLTTDKQPFDKAYFVFSIIWEKDKIQWLLNDEVYHEVTPESTEAYGQPYPFNDKFFLLMNLSVGGNLPKAVPIEETFPTDFIIDYIRIFQK